MVKKMTECITTWESILDSYFLKPDNFLKSDPSFLSFGSLLLLQWSYHIETQFLENSNATKIRKIHCITLHHRVILRHGILFVENEISKWYQKSPTPGDVYDIGSEMINRFCCNSLVANANIWLSILVSVNRVTKSQVQDQWPQGLIDTWKARMNDPKLTFIIFPTLTSFRSFSKD